MISKLISLLLSTLILACPFNCMPESEEGVESVSQPCCSHCQSKSQENPQPISTDCCQCFCAGAIVEGSSQLELTLSNLIWEDFSQKIELTQLPCLNHQHNRALFDPDLSSGRQIRCLQMSFQC